MENNSINSLEKKASQTGKDEVGLQKGLTVCAIAAAATIPIIGQFGLAAAGGIMAGKAIRKYVKSDSKEAYQARKTLNNIYEMQFQLKKIREGSRNVQNQLNYLSQDRISQIKEIEISSRRGWMGGDSLDVEVKYDE